MSRDHKIYSWMAGHPPSHTPHTPVHGPDFHHYVDPESISHQKPADAHLANREKSQEHKTPGVIQLFLEERDGELKPSSHSLKKLPDWEWIHLPIHKAREFVEPRDDKFAHWEDSAGFVRYILHDAHHDHNSYRDHHSHHDAHAQRLERTDHFQDEGLKIVLRPPSLPKSQSVYEWANDAFRHVNEIQRSWLWQLEDAYESGKLSRVIAHYLDHLPELRTWANSKGRAIDLEFLALAHEEISVYDRFLMMQAIITEDQIHNSLKEGKPLHDVVALFTWRLLYFVEHHFHGHKSNPVIDGMFPKKYGHH